jgi:hypothetical protein
MCKLKNGSSSSGRLNQEDHEFKVSLGYSAKPCTKTNKQTNWQKYLRG